MIIKDKTLLLYLDKENRSNKNHKDIEEYLIKTACRSKYSTFKSMLLGLVFNTNFAKSGIDYIDNSEKKWQVLVISRFQAIDNGLNKFADNIRLTLVIIFIFTLVLKLFPLIPVIGIISYLFEKSIKKKLKFLTKTLTIYTNYCSGEWDYRLKDATDNFLLD